MSAQKKRKIGGVRFETDSDDPLWDKNAVEISAEEIEAEKQASASASPNVPHHHHYHFEPETDPHNFDEDASKGPKKILLEKPNPTVVPLSEEAVASLDRKTLPFHAVNFGLLKIDSVYETSALLQLPAADVSEASPLSWGHLLRTISSNSYSIAFQTSEANGSTTATIQIDTKTDGALEGDSLVIFAKHDGQVVALVEIKFTGSVMKRDRGTPLLKPNIHFVSSHAPSDSSEDEDDKDVISSSDSLPTN